jgi:SAM-dependent methyltransferase
MVVLPPGTLLQLMYLGERLRGIPPGRFIEIGPGGGEITHRLLQAGWTGTVYDLAEGTANRLKQRFAVEIASGRLTVLVGDFLAAPRDQEAPVDLVISCMVMEHLDEVAQRSFMACAQSRLNAGGRMIGLVPGSPKDWGIEDDIAGHFRRYNQGSLDAMLAQAGWRPRHMAGLTFPLSNILLPLSNYLVRRKEANKLELDFLERTKHSGQRNVRFKTHFPTVLKWVLNEQVLRPLHWLQKLFSDSERALVIYFEATSGALSDADKKRG